MKMSIEVARYGIRMEGDRSWTVFDIYTGWPFEYLGRSLDGLEEADARRLFVVLNALHQHRMRTIDQEIQDLRD